MNSNLLFDFIANKENNTLTIRREFAAKRQLVWDCHTKSELLDRWFAPKPLTTKTKSMDVVLVVSGLGANHWSSSSLLVWQSHTSWRLAANSLRMVRVLFSLSARKSKSRLLFIFYFFKV